MNKKIIVDANFPNETRVVLLDSNNNIEEIEYETANKQQNKGNIYLARVTRIEPSLQAVFIEYGNDKSGFLPFIEIHNDYINSSGKNERIFIDNLKDITPPVITNDDLNTFPPLESFSALEAEEEIDLKLIEKIVDDKISADLELEASETDIDLISNKEIIPQKEFKIQEVLKKGQLLLVQVTKEERGNKGASFTTYISLAGKYCVLMPNKHSQNGISRKIVHTDERKRLKNIISDLAPTDKTPISIIARTAAMGHSVLDIKRDYDYLVRLWNNILRNIKQTGAPYFIHQEEGIIQKIIRDMLSRQVQELIIQGSNAYQKAAKFINEISPNDIHKLKEYKNKVPIFTQHNIEDQLIKLYQPVISLPSGGYIVINPTEALISIDVNSGRSTSERNIEDTALKTNLESAKEIARQVKLRDLSGLLVIDFIDMQESRNRKIIERSFKEYLKRDRARIQIANISTFGLLEMSRQRMRPSFLESNSTICNHCNGKGVVRANESNSMLILRTIENEIFEDSNELDIVNVYANIDAVTYILNYKRHEIIFIEQKYGIKLNFHIDSNAMSDNYSLEKIKSAHKGQVQNSPVTVNKNLPARPQQHAAKQKIKHKKNNPKDDSYPAENKNIISDNTNNIILENVVKNEVSNISISTGNKEDVISTSSLEITESKIADVIAVNASPPRKFIRKRRKNSANKVTKAGNNITYSEVK